MSSTPADSPQFWDDVAVVGRAVTEAFAPVKLDNLVMGHRCPHLHCHVYPQYAHDDPFGPVDISSGTTRLSPQEQRERVRTLRELMTAQLADDPARYPPGVAPSPPV